VLSTVAAAGGAAGAAPPEASSAFVADGALPGRGDVLDPGAGLLPAGAGAG
jgi:hypothetical protein